MPALLVSQGPLLGVTFPIGEELTVGRAAGATVQLIDLQVSRLHASLRREGERFLLLDASSRNGIFVNDQRMKGEKALEPLDEVSIGASRFVFRAPERFLPALYGAGWALVCQEPSPAPVDDLLSPLNSVASPLSAADLALIQSLFQVELTPETVATKALHYVMRQVSAARGALFRRVKEGELPVALVVAWGGISEGPAQSAEKALAIRREALDHLNRGEAFRLEGELTLTQFPAGRRRVFSQPLAALSIPLDDVAPVRDAFWLEKSLDDGPFTPEQAGWLLAFAPWVAIALRDAMRRGESRRRDQLDIGRLEGARISGKKLLTVTGVLETAQQLASSQDNISIIGPHGIGKDRIARALHTLSPRWEGPFASVNCTTLSEDQLRLELFGAEPHALPGFEVGVTGRLELLSGGSLVLLEVEGLPPAVQHELLNVILFGEGVRQGGDTPFPVNVRLIASSSRSPVQWLKDGRLRADLVGRLTAQILELPRLEMLHEHFETIVLAVIGRMNRRLARRVKGVSPTALAWLKTRDYPLQMWDLEDLIIRAMPLCEGSQLTRDDLELAEMTPASTGENDVGAGRRLSDTLRDTEKRIFSQALRLAKGSRVEAASLLGIPRRQFDRKLLEYGLVPT